MAKEGLRKWFSRNQGKGWVDCKTGNHVEDVKVKNENHTQHADLQWLNVLLQ